MEDQIVRINSRRARLDHVISGINAVVLNAEIKHFQRCLRLTINQKTSSIHTGITSIQRCYRIVFITCLFVKNFDTIVTGYTEILSFSNIR